MKTIVLAALFALGIGLAHLGADLGGGDRQRRQQRCQSQFAGRRRLLPLPRVLLARPVRARALPLARVIAGNSAAGVS